MDKLEELAGQKNYPIGGLTIGQSIELAEELGMRVSEVAVREAMIANKMTREAVLSAVTSAFSHNMYALEVGISSGKSFLLGNIGQELAEGNITLNDDAFLNKALCYTLAAQVGNHVIGLQPCAGTGDSCPYSGLVRAMMESFDDQDEVALLAALILKIGTIFRVGKVSTGCNMEGLGAGSAAAAAVMAEIYGASPEQVGKAIVLALSPTIGVPCTPRVMVAGLCATHIGGAVLNGNLAAKLAAKTSIPVNVPVDVMIALAAAVHIESAKHLVPVVINYMEPFFRTNEAVEKYISQAVKDREREKMEAAIADAAKQAQNMARKANSIIKPFGDAVVGGSSQAVGSPTNTARIAHELAKGEIRGVKIELYPELFARRGINIPGILMAAVYGAGTDNAAMYRAVMEKVKDAKLAVEIVEADEYQMQKITIYASGKNAFVEALNRGGGRLAIRNVSCPLQEAKSIARKLNIDIVE